jgi:regulator of extracellular matrix RemA (YlzA/DUF370 family)
MSLKPIHIGFDNIIFMNRVIAMLSPKQQPIKRLIQEARSKGVLIDATHARKAKCVIILDTGHIVIAAISAEAIMRRLSTIKEDDGLKGLTDE